MLFNELNEDNFLLFAIKNYQNTQAVTKKDFDKDLTIFRYIKRLLNKYKNGEKLRVNLLINHFTVLYNVFGEAATPMLFFKMGRDMWPQVKAFIIFLNRFPDYPKTELHNIPVDLNCYQELYNIFKSDDK